MKLDGITVTEVKSAVTVYAERGKHYQMRNRALYGLSLCIDGQITYIQNGREYVSDRGCAVILPKGGEYYIRKDKTGHFPLINFDCLLPLCDTITVIPLKNTEQLISGYKRLERLFLFDGSRAQIFSIFYGMLHGLCSDDVPSQLRGALRMIRGRYGDFSLTNEDLAAECNMSEVYFRRLFKNHFGCSPKQFVIEIRIQKAKQLLSEGALSVSAISERCGFSSTYHFSRLFKQHTGLSPSEYRRINHINEI
ncbi:MAG: AraC family transcriptional regulator [Clostridia bacterium]|nr:AraC family transcriptional regulator [Clostridia bacterium]